MREPTSKKLSWRVCGEQRCVLVGKDILEQHYQEMSWLMACQEAKLDHRTEIIRIFIGESLQVNMEVWSPIHSQQWVASVLFLVLRTEWGPGHTPKHTPSDVPPPSRLYLLKVPKPHQAAPSTGDQVFKYVSLLGPVLVMRLLKLRLLGALQQAWFMVSETVGV